MLFALKKKINYTVYIVFVNYIVVIKFLFQNVHGKEMIRTSRCKNTIFSKYFALPMAIFPL